MTEPVFNEKETGLPDLDLVVDPTLLAEKTKDQTAGDELILPEEELLRQKTTQEIFVMRNQKKAKEASNKIMEKREDEKIQSTDVPVNKEEERDNLQFKIEDIDNDKTPSVTRRGKRGNDKKPRKKRVMTEKQKENLRKAREKSLAVRRAKKEAKLKNKKVVKKENEKIYSSTENTKIKTQPQPIPKSVAPTPVIQQPQMSFDYFCNLMDRYEERKMKKHTTSQEPHPNKKIPHTQKPRPPIQKVQRKAPIVREPPTNFNAYDILQNRRNGSNSLFGSAFGY
tara:strand:- start:563 stop:1408 length:846 start_codon:yes stop_codon:yes gene_type:complete